MSATPLPQRNTLSSQETVHRYLRATILGELWWRSEGCRKQFFREYFIKLKISLKRKVVTFEYLHYNYNKLAAHFLF